MLYNAWSPVIVALRRRRNFSQEATAKRAQVSVRTWRRWETGRRQPRPEHLGTIAAALACSPEKLAFEYSRLLLRYYCKQKGYEFPDSLAFQSTESTQSTQAGSKPAT